MDGPECFGDSAAVLVRPSIKHIEVIDRSFQSMSHRRDTADDNEFDVCLDQDSKQL